MVRVGISGFGRISRVVMRAAMDMEDVEIAGINWRNSDLDYIVYMLKYDSTFGRFPGTVEKYDKGIMVNGKKIPVFMEGDAHDIPWGDCGAEYIMEGTGAYNTTEKAQAHLDAGAKKVIISGKGQGDPDLRIWRKPRRVQAGIQRGIQRILHNKLPGTAVQGNQRQLGHRSGPDVHHSCGNRKAEGSRCSFHEGLAYRQKRIRQRNSVFHRRSKGCWSGNSGTAGQDDRYFLPSTDF